MTDRKRVIRIRVTHEGRPSVNLTVPLGLARFARVGGIADRLSSEHGIDLDELLREIDRTPDGKIVDVVDEKKGDHVEISVETAAGSETEAVGGRP